MNQLKIRPLQKNDIDVLSELFFPWSTKEKTLSKWIDYFDEQQSGNRMARIVEKQGQILGYGHLVFQSKYFHFSENLIPEIHDLWVFEDYRNKGIGTSLITHLEQLAVQQGFGQVGLGVGLYNDYGPAQRLYIRLGFKPDGKGITYKHVPVIPGQTYPIDDDLNLWLTKTI